jgi:GT2 family glycosyltransferase
LIIWSEDRRPKTEGFRIFNFFQIFLKLFKPSGKKADIQIKKKSNQIFWINKTNKDVLFISSSILSLKNKSMKLSILVPVFNNLNFTKKCLTNLKHEIDQTKVDDLSLDIVVINDGSTDNTASWVKANHPEVHLLKGDGNLWWSGGINKGVVYSLDELNADYILWWNNDILAKENYFNKLYNILKTNSTNTLIGSKIISIKGDQIFGIGGIFDPVKGIRYMIGNEVPLKKDIFHEPIEVDWFPGMGTTIHKSVFQKIGLVDEKNFPQYHGDSDFTYRARINGYKLIAYPSLLIENDMENTGLEHEDSFNNLMQSLTSIKSNFNLRKDILFINKYRISHRAYNILFKKYITYIGGFAKWKLLGIFGQKRAKSEHKI